MTQFTNTILVLGGDGYLGWSLSLALANRTDYKVIIVDNLIKRQWEKSVEVSPLVNLAIPSERIANYKKIFRKNNLCFEEVDLTDYEQVLNLINKYSPRIIINAAQQPSAPFSMMSPLNAKITFENNIETNLNVLWAISRFNTEIKYIKLGSAGSYLSIDSDFIPKSKVNLAFEYGGLNRQILNSWLPMQASDFYHQSKIDSFLLSDLCSNIWGLKIITVQQSTIFGHTIYENTKKDNHALMTRYNYDDIFGTVINRFVCQALLNFPLTIYGNGDQKTGIISLNDTVNNFINLVERKIGSGEHQIEHNFTHKLSINQIADSLKTIINVDLQHIVNPRIEKDTKLKKEFEQPGFFGKKISNMESFILELQNLVEFTSHYKNNINKNFILPKVRWSNK